MDVERHEPIGGIYLAARRWGLGPAEELVTAAQSLAAQIASAVHSTHVYERTLAHQRVQQELALAGAIQASFLPRELPTVPGWELAVWFVPARQTSGDFFDWIALPDGKLGLVVADVADKGMGAALYMALSRTLLRTYAVEHAGRPDLALQAANRRILSDTSSTMFVTVFFGVLDPETGVFSYANAGHNPPYLFNGGEPQPLPATGIPLGLFERTWRCESLVLGPGDALLLYTDGVTDAEHTERGFFGVARLLDAARSAPRGSAPALKDAIERAVHDWIGESPPHDDITMLVLTRATEQPL